MMNDDAARALYLQFVCAGIAYSQMVVVEIAPKTHAGTTELYVQREEEMRPLTGVDEGELAGPIEPPKEALDAMDRLKKGTR